MIIAYKVRNHPLSLSFIMMSRSVFCLFLALQLTTVVNAWSPNPFSRFGAVQHSYIVSSSADKEVEVEVDEESVLESRRRFLTAAAMNVCLIGAASPAIAAAAAGAEEGSTTIYRSGKPPMVPGQKPKDKSDTKGTRKDPDFLRSISDCKSQCQSTNGPDGFAKAKEDCLSECQDICCTTYEQCTFAIVPRI
jgi:hypothetical protein